MLAVSVRGIRRVAQKVFNLPSATDLEGFYIWLAEGRRFHDTNGVNMHGLWEEILWHVYKEGIDWFR